MTRKVKSSKRSAGTHFSYNLSRPFIGLAIALIGQGVQAQGTPVTDPYTQTRTSSFTYFTAADGIKNGLLKTETVEPDSAQNCVLTAYDYDAAGNRNSATTSNCAGATGVAVFASRSSTTTYSSQSVLVVGQGVTTPAGTFATSVLNALAHKEDRTYDPRFGSATSLTGPNGLTTTWTLDSFGRKVREQRADSTASVSYYCYLSPAVSDTSSNSPGCPVPAASEIPAEAAMFVHTESRNTSDLKNGPFSRVYSDKAGRRIRTVTEAFDAASQPGGASRLIVQDTDYSQYGTQVVTTQPYFLISTSSTATGSADYGMTRTDYDVLGRATTIYSADAQGQAGSQSFGTRGSRVASKTTNAYAGLSTTTTNDKNQTRTEQKNVTGQVIRITDALGAQVAHQHDAFGNLVKTKDALQNVVTIAYDMRGRKVRLEDPDSGLWTYNYNALGELVWQQNAKQRAAVPIQSTTMAYDVLGRMTQRVEPDYTSTWKYDKNADGSFCMNGTVATRGAGKLCETSTSTSIGRKFVYDALGRPLNARTTVTGGPSFASAVSYDTQNGRLLSQTYPSGVVVNYGYTGKGYVSSLTLGTSATVSPLPSTVGGSPVAGTTLAAGSVLWSAQAYNAWGKVEKQTFGNGVVNNASFEALTGRVATSSAGIGAATNVLSHTYSWNSLGQLTQRNDANGDGVSGAVADTFEYDSIGRLQAYQVDAFAIPDTRRRVTLQYNALGMMLSKSDVGVYTYGAQATVGVRPHALLSVAGATTTSYTYDANGNLTTASAGKYQSISYTSFNLPDSQTGAQGPSGTPKYTWVYDENHQRIKESRLSGGVTRVTWSVHPDNQGGLGFECDSSTTQNCSGTDTSQRHYLSVGGASIGVLASGGALPTLGAAQLTPPTIASITLVKVEYWHKDHLGSLMATTDHQGNVTQRYSYDPFGKRRQAAGQYDAFGTLVIDWTNNTNKGTDRGFTGHEHLDDLGLIHMNGRIFDPTLGRFLQSDPLIQDPGNLQNFDRYSYCYNNPLTCTDPSGHSFLSQLWKDLWHMPSFRIGLAILGSAIVGPEVANWALANTSAGVALAEAGYAGVTTAAISGFTGGAMSTGTSRGAASGALTAALFYQVGSFADGMETFGPLEEGATDIWRHGGLGRAALHGVVGCVGAAAGGEKCGPGMLSASLSELAAPLRKGNAAKGLVVSMAVGGTASAISGGKFANGAVTAAYGYLFNYLSHEARARLVGAGVFLGGTAGVVAAGGCTAGTGGVCALGAPTLVAGGMAAGAVTAEAIANAWDQLDNLLTKATNAGPQAVQYALLAERAGLYPTVGGDLVQLNAGDVWKYGISTDHAGRYPAQALSVLGLRMEIESRGTLPQVYVAEKIQLINYAVSNGALPPGNRIFK